MKFPIASNSLMHITGPDLLKYLKKVIKDPKPRTKRWISTSIPQDKWDEPSAKYCSAEYHTNNLLVGSIKIRNIQHHLHLR